MSNSSTTTMERTSEMGKTTRRFLFLAGAFAALAIGVACSSGNNSGGKSSGQPDSLVFDKTQVNLGSVEQDSRGVATFLASNYGGMPITVGPVEVETIQGESGGKSVQGSAVSVNPMKVYPVPVRIGPFSQLGPHRITAKVSSTDPMARASTLTVNLTVVEAPPPPSSGPRLRVDKQLIEGGTVPYNWPLYEQFTLRNDGDAPLVLGGMPKVRTELGC